MKAVVREATLTTLEDQSATVTRGDAVLRYGTAERRKALEFCADVIAARVAAQLAGRVGLSEEERMDVEQQACTGRETTASIAVWQNETFGPATTTWDRVDRSDEKMRGAMWSARCLVNDPASEHIPRPNLSRAIHAAEELAELIELLVEDDNDPKACAEVADVSIVLAGIPAAHGHEQTDDIDAKMAVNRGRTWSTSGDGHGQHVEDEK